MIENFLYKCPLCLKEDSIKTEDRCQCTNCAAQFERVGRNIKIDGQLFACSQLYEKIKRVSLEALPNSELNLASGELLYKESKRALLRQGRQRVPYHGFGGIFSILEILEKIDEGQFYITNRNFFFKGNNGVRKFPLEHITCVTTDSQDFVFKSRGQPYFHIRFIEESPLKYEDMAREILRAFWKGEHIVEFQPRIVFADRKKTWLKRRKYLMTTDEGGLKVRFLDTIVFALIKTLAYPVFRYYLGARLFGNENIPQTGPFILILNHEGYFDSFFLIAWLKRKVAFFAKNTEFKSAFFRWILRVFRAVPVRRYEIDPSVIRNAIKLLSKGQPVGIFIEAERTWDGEFLPPKRGVVKFLLRADVPIVPCLIRGSFECMPRWEHRITRTSVKMVIGKPFKLQEKEGDLEEIGAFLMKKIKSL